MSGFKPMVTEIEYRCSHYDTMKTTCIYSQMVVLTFFRLMLTRSDQQ